MEKHTVLPWQFWYKSVFSGADPVCRGENDDDLRYIVTACNAYPALVKALKACVYTLNNELPTGNLSAITAKAMAHDALALAKGEQ